MITKLKIRKLTVGKLVSIGTRQGHTFLGES